YSPTAVGADYRCRATAEAQAPRTRLGDRQIARPSASDPAATAQQENLKENRRYDERKMGRNHEIGGVQRKRYEPLAPRVRALRSRGAPAIPEVPAHSGQGNSVHPGVEQESRTRHIVPTTV